MTAFIIYLGLVSLAGTAGLAFAPPRPRAQEFWATVALAPLFLLLCLIVTGA